VKPDTAMRLGAMEEERDADVGDVPCDDDEQYGHPPVAGPGTEMEHCEPSLTCDDLSGATSVRRAEP
jgi:hypothetical protein